MILTAIVLLLIAVGLIIYIIALVERSKGIRARWNGALRHIVALILGWVSFATLSGLLVLLDLFESNKFSLVTFAGSLFTPLIIFIAGMVALRIFLITSDQ
jgi:hypothetical protein